MNQDNGKGKRLSRPESRSEHREYAISFLLDGMPEYQYFDIELEDAERLQRAFNHYVEHRDDTMRFFYFVSPDDTHVLFSMADLQMVNFLFDYVPDDSPDKEPDPDLELEPESEPELAIEIYFRGRSEPFSALPRDTREIGEMFIQLDGSGTTFTARFVDENGELVCMDPMQIVLLTASGDLVEMEDLSIYRSVAGQPDEDSEDEEE